MSRQQKNKRTTQRQMTNRNTERRIVTPKSENQRNYIISMVENDITFCTGPAGSGKSSVSVGLACNWLQDNKVSRIIITRPTVEAGRGIGFIPGTLEEKMLPYMMPVLEEMNKYLGREAVSKLRDVGVIEMCPLEYMRGRNFHNCFIILDEAQNATYEQIKMVMTRIGIGSRVVVNGDIDQSDLPNHAKGGMVSIMNKLYDLDGVGICELDSTDIVRHSIIGKVLERLK